MSDGQWQEGHHVEASEGCSTEGVFGVDERFVFNKALVSLAGGYGSGREVSASGRLSDVYAYFDLSTAVGHSEPKEGLLRVMATSVTAVTYGPPTTPISELDLAIVNGHNVGAHVQTCPRYDSESNPGLSVHSRMIYHYTTRRHPETRGLSAAITQLHRSGGEMLTGSI
ncbi:hypothetical protein Bbelb_268940 [Branchiostoma belcheri]|nr:hypothetical protein Bbelb_268940 [Branchiostoma belcheri]